ncbi:hypothetical protein D3C87_2112640 [compost metagenome]
MEGYADGKSRLHPVYRHGRHWKTPDREQQRFSDELAGKNDVDTARYDPSIRAHAT